MTSITRNLPWFVRDLGISVVGQECYVSLVENLNVSDVPCIKYTVSKGLGIGVVLGGAIMKVPQIMLILKARSARGLSLSAFSLETIAYAINLTYSFRNHYPFSTYGENFFLTIQNTLITLLIIYYAPGKSSLTLKHEGRTSQVLTGAVVSFLVAVALYIMPAHLLSLLQLGTVPLSLFSKIPQIAQNHRDRSTGQLSAFAVVSQVLGCTARLFTTFQEVDDFLVSSGFVLALVLNLIVASQMYAYWGRE
ncbi:mannose-P-dolichol utilization defect 1 protein, partial [Fistulina hepatica ATCC 64428]